MAIALTLPTVFRAYDAFPKPVVKLSLIRGVSEQFAGTPKPSALHGRLNALRVFRNRVAHHEHLLNQDLDAISDDLDVILGQICPATATWVRALSDVADVRQRRPR